MKISEGKTFKDYLISESNNIADQYDMNQDFVLKALSQIATAGSASFSNKLENLILQSPPDYLISIYDSLNIPVNELKSKSFDDFKRTVFSQITNNIQDILIYNANFQEILYDHSFLTPYTREFIKENLENIKKNKLEKFKTNLTILGASSCPPKTPNNSIPFYSSLDELSNYNLNLEFPKKYLNEEIENLRSDFLNFKTEVISQIKSSTIVNIEKSFDLFKSHFTNKKDIKNILLLEKQEHPEIYHSYINGDNRFKTGGIHSLFGFIIEHFAKMNISESNDTINLSQLELSDKFNEYQAIYKHFQESETSFNSSALVFVSILLKNEIFVQQLIEYGSKTLDKKLELRSNLLLQVNDFLSKYYEETLTGNILNFPLSKSNFKAKQRVEVINSFKHDKSFRSITYKDQTYTFGRIQSDIIRALFNHFKDDPSNKGLTTQTLNGEIDTNSKNLNNPKKLRSIREIFRSNGKQHKIWNSLLKYKSSSKTYCLNFPSY